MELTKCDICLLSESHVVSVNDVDINNVRWSTKIQSIIPELVEIEDFTICKNCIQKLEEFLHFKEMLLNILTKWKLNTETEQKFYTLENMNCTDKQVQTVYSSENGLVLRNGAVDFTTSDISLYTNNQVSEMKDDKIIMKENIEVCYDNESLEDNPKSYECLNDNTDYDCFNDQNINNQTKYKCCTCKNFYINLKNLQSHQKYCIGQTPHDVEKVDIDTKGIKGRSSSRTFICEVCQEKFNKVRLIVDHYISIHSYAKKNIKPYTCDKCPQKFSTINLLYQHLKYHDRDRTKMCTTCGKSFITSSDLMSHQYIHLNRRNYVCNTCSKAFNTNKNLRTHILVVHTDKTLWKFQCKICDKKFPQKSNFDQHSKRHVGDKQHVCHICEKPFISSSELKRHVQLHSNIKHFFCAPCGTEYKTKRSYQQHVDRKHLNADQRNHASAKKKEFGCHICPTQFHDRAKLLGHLSRHHNVTS